MTKKEANDLLQKALEEFKPAIRGFPDVVMRMFNDVDLVDRLEARFSKYKEDLLKHPENHKNGELEDKHIHGDNYPRIMTMGIFLGALSANILWQEHLGTSTPKQKKQLVSDAETLRNIAGHLMGMDNLFMCDFKADLLSEIADGLDECARREMPSEFAFALNLKKSRKAFFIRVVHANLCKELPCIQTKHSSFGYNQSAPNIEVARIVHHLLCEPVSSNDVAQVMKKERREYWRDKE